MSFTYYLPDENGNKKEYEATSNSLVIIGANGSGKSKLGAWIEQQNMENVHRIGAQRNLNFQENVPLKSYSQAEDFVFYGSDDKSSQKNKGQRWNWGKSFTTKLMDDFDNVLAALIALKNNDNEKFVKECKTAPTRAERPDPPITAIDKLIQIWDEIFPQRKLEVNDAKFLASLRDGTGSPYSSNQMSDGERAVLYLTAQVLCVPRNKTLIIDEPEVHFILGSRKNVLFVEGEKNSYDTQLYTILYPNYYVIACGSCTQVIARTKAFRSNPALHHCEVYGLIDRDYRSDYEIRKYKEEFIYTLDVAEVESLFLVEGLIQLLATHLGRNPDEVFASIKNYIVNVRFAKQIDKQICQSVVAHLKYQLSSIELSKKSDDEAKASLNAALQAIDYEKTKSEQETKFREALAGADYASILRVFNEKGIINSIGHFFGLNDKEYYNTILYLLKGRMHDEIIDAVSKYLPTEIPR